MDSVSATGGHRPNAFFRLLPTVGPVILVSISYVDPGKWTATIEGGARFGGNLFAPLVYFNLIAIFCHYLTARISLIAGKDLAQICYEEYDRWTCMFLGVQSMISVITLDLTMILGIAHGLHLLFGLDLSTCMFLTAADTISFPLFCTFSEKYKESGCCTIVAGGVLLLCFFGVLTCQTDTHISSNGILARLNEENAYALMSLLGSGIVPHNLYIHSSLISKQRAEGVTLGSVCQHHLLAIAGVFGCVCMANCMLMNSASNVFYNTGLVLLTYPDALSIMEVFRGPVVPFVCMLIIYICNQIVAITWSLHGQGVLHGFLGMDIPSWLQRATIRILAIVPALFCVWTSGVEGLYQLLVFSQVIVAVMLPCSLVPLFRVASSRALMGAHKISQFLEFLAIVAFMGLLGLKIIFVVELIFGDCEWIANLSWNMGSFSSVPYVFLLVTSCFSLCFVLWLAATPLKSATRLDGHVWNWDSQKNEVPSGENLSKHFSLKQTEQPKVVHKLPDLTVSDSNIVYTEKVVEPYDLRGSAAAKGHFEIKTKSASNVYQEELISAVADVPDASPLPVKDAVDVTALHLPADFSTKDEDEGEIWESEDPSGAVPASLASAADGPASYSSLTGKSEDSYSSIGSLSRLAGLGRAARRQLAQILDEFWGKLYDLHGQPSAEAKSRKLEILWSDCRQLSSPPKADAARKQLPGYFLSQNSSGSDVLLDSPKQLIPQAKFDAVHLAQHGPYRSTPMQMLDAYVQASNRHPMESSEKLYSGLRPSAAGWDNQPATVHGYHIASIANRIAREMNYAQRDVPSCFPLRNYGDSSSYVMGQPLQHELNFSQPSAYSNLAVSRNTALQNSDRLPYDPAFSRGIDCDAMLACNTKKFRSLPDISGLAGAYKDIYMSENGNNWINSSGYRSSLGKVAVDPPFYPSAGSGPVRSSAFDELPKCFGQSQGYGDNQMSYGLPSDPGSIWSKQPFEVFVPADKTRPPGTNPGISTSSPLDSESTVLQSLRFCILKLLKLEGSEWLFRQNDGADEVLIDRVAARERCLYEAETREISLSRNIQTSDVQYPQTERKSGLAGKSEDAVLANILVSSIPHCGEGCVWRVDLIVSFGVWCIHRVLDLSLMESRPELWGKYTYVLNRLQGVIDPAFSKSRTVKSPCFCLQLSAADLPVRSSPPTNGMLPPASKPARGKCTTASTLLDLIKDVETAVSCRKGRSGTAAGDVAYPKGKENLASVLKRYKRRLSNKAAAGK